MTHAQNQTVTTLAERLQSLCTPEDERRHAARTTIFAGNNNSLATSLLNRLRQSSTAGEWHLADIKDFCSLVASGDPEQRYVYIPSLSVGDGMAPDLSEAKWLFEQAGKMRGGKFILISSALIYGIGAGRQALVSEDYSAARNHRYVVGTQWRALEALAHDSLDKNAQLTVLRPVTVVPSPGWLSQRLLHKFVLTLPGHDPTLQLLSISDLAEAVRSAIEQNRPGVFNVAPDGVVPLHAAIALLREKTSSTCAIRGQFRTGK